MTHWVDRASAYQMERGPRPVHLHSVRAVPLLYFHVRTVNCGMMRVSLTVLKWAGGRVLDVAGQGGSEGRQRPWLLLLGL